MPVIEMYVPKGILDENTKRALHNRVSRQVLQAEGATYDESPRAQAVTWMLIHEMSAGSWSIGSDVLSGADGARVLTRVNVPHGSLNDERRADVAVRVNREVVDVLGEEFADPTKSFCLIVEQTFTGGGIVVDFANLAQWLKLPHLIERNQKEAATSDAAGA
jgi:phenylpyruvate tautomerase PptA (4-oxalocrotonate tautomerase family)